MLTISHRPLKRLQGLLVADVMAREVAVISETAAMDEAAVQLTARGASGAPVVDRRGSCIGVLSATDFMRFERLMTESDRVRLGKAGGDRPGQLPWNSVQRYMSTPVHTISPAASVMQAAELMCAKHIHRLIVLDDSESPVGLISTLDIVAALVHAVDEDRQQQQCKE